MATNVSDVVDEARFTGYHWLIVVLCGFMIFLDGFDLTSISFAAPDFLKFLGVDRSVVAPVFSAGLFGLTLGALGFGLIGDRWGVKRTFILCGVFFGIFSILTATATSVTTLVLYRFLAGLALGGATPISIAIASDYMPKRIRTSVVMVMYISLALGQVAAGYTYGFFEAFGWRSVFYVGGVLPIVFAPLYIALLPENLEFLVMKGAAPARINAILARLAPGRAFNESSFVVAKENKEGFQPALLFEDGRAAMTIALWVTFFSSLIALYFFNNWLPVLLTGSGLTKPQIVVITTALPFGGIIGTLFAARIVLRRNGFGTACAGYFLAALAMIVLGLVGGGFVVLAVCTLLVGLFLIGTQSVLNASCAVVYPPSMRATGVGWGFGIGRIGSVISPAIAGYLVSQHWQPSALFMIAALPTLVASAGAFAVLRIVTRPAAAATYS